MHGLSWRRFLPPVLLSKSRAWRSPIPLFGEIAERYQWLPLALAVSIALPVLMVPRFAPGRDRTEPH